MTKPGKFPKVAELKKQHKSSREEEVQYPPMASIDYELSMAEDEEAEEDTYIRHARTRAAYRSSTTTITSQVLGTAITVLALILLQ